MHGILTSQIVSKYKLHKERLICKEETSSIENISAKNNDSPIFLKKSSYIDNKFSKYFNELFFLAR